jgi:NADH-quinone oxidoreductase subunit J
VLTLSALMVVSVRNPVYSVLFLILAFFNAAGLFLLIGAEYIAMTLVIVYVGAVAVLFLFVVMMLDINITEMKQGFLRYLPAGLVVAGLFFVEIILAIYASLKDPSPLLQKAAIPLAEGMTNTRAIGNVLYTDYVLLFQLAGLVLLVAMIGAIVLTHRSRPGVRRQDIGNQISRSRKNAIELISLKPGEGAS